MPVAVLTVAQSTLLNLIQDKLVPQEGYIHVNGQLRLGIFTQHHLDSFDLSQSPLQNMLTRWPKAIEVRHICAVCRCVRFLTFTICRRICARTWAGTRSRATTRSSP